MTITIKVQNWRRIPEHLAAMHAIKETYKNLADGKINVGDSFTQDDYHFNGIEFTTTIKQ